MVLTQKQDNKKETDEAMESGDEDPELVLPLKSTFEVAEEAKDDVADEIEEIDTAGVKAESR